MTDAELAEEMVELLAALGAAADAALLVGCTCFGVTGRPMPRADAEALQAEVACAMAGELSPLDKRHGTAAVAPMPGHGRTLLKDQPDGTVILEVEVELSPKGVR